MRGLMALRQVEGLGHADNIRHILRSGAQAKLLRAAGLAGMQARAFTHIQRPNALWPVELVRPQGKQIYVEGTHADR